MSGASSDHYSNHATDRAMLSEAYAKVHTEDTTPPESIETLMSNPKENKLVWSNPEPKLWTAVSIESGEPKGYYADVIAIGDGRCVASVFDCINIARDEARANGEDFDEAEDAEQHLADFIEDYSATTYTQEIEDAEEQTELDFDGRGNVGYYVTVTTHNSEGGVTGVSGGGMVKSLLNIPPHIQKLIDNPGKYNKKVEITAKKADGSIVPFNPAEDAESTNALKTDDVESNLIKKGGFDESEEGFAAFVASRNKS